MPQDENVPQLSDGATHRDSVPGLPWFALRVRSNCERMVATYLHGHGYDLFMPTYRSQRVWSDRTKILEMPLFAGYLFCRLDASRRLDVMKAPGLVDIVSFGRTMATIPDKEIEAVRVLSAQLTVEPWPFLREGAMVRVERGPLAGVEGVLIAKKSLYCVVVSVQILGRSVAAQVDPACVRVLAGATAA